MQQDDLAVIMRALGHPVRLEILRILAQKAQNCCCNDITDCLPLAQSTVSQHLKVLLDAGVIEREAKGTRNNYRVCTEKLGAFSEGARAYVEALGTDAEACSSTLDVAS